MNNIYRVIWNAARKCWVITSELSKSRGKSKSSRMAVVAPVMLALGTGIFSTTVGAKDYNGPITGPFQFNDGDTVTNIYADDYDASVIPRVNAITADGTEIISSGALTINTKNTGSISALNGGMFTSTGKIISVGGVYSGNGVGVSTLNLADADITTLGKSKWDYGLAAGSKGIVNATGDLKIKTAGSSSSGIRISKGGVVNVKNADINSSEVGIYTSDAGSTFTSTGYVNIDASQGIFSLAGNYALNSIDIKSKGTGVGLTYTNLTSTGQMNIQSPGVGFSIGNGAVVQLADLSINTTGNNAAGLSGANTMTHTGTVDIKTLGTGAHGMVYNGGGGSHYSSTPDFSNVNISTTGDNSDAVLFHAPNLVSGGSYTTNYLIDTPNILSGLSVSGTDSALIGVRTTAWRYAPTVTLQDQNVSMSQVGDKSWGFHVFGDATTSTLVLSGNSDTGGTGVWLQGRNADLTLSDNASMAGSRLKFGDNLASSLNISTNSNSAAVGSLEGLGTIGFASAGGSLNLGQNNTTNNGSMVDNADFSGRLTNVSALTKTGTLTQILSGVNTVGSANVQQGTLQFSQSGKFITTGNYDTQSGATTDTGRNGSILQINGVFTQAAGASLMATVNSGSPAIIADSAVLDGELNLQGFSFSSGGTPAKASAIGSTNYVLIRTTNGITGNFTNDISQATNLDYLMQNGGINGNNYTVGFQTAWENGGKARGTGSFTLAGGSTFEYDTGLSDQTAPAGGFDSGWDGQSLTKAGAGALILSAANSYTGGTTLNDGTLKLSGAGTLGAATASTTMTGGTLDLGTTTQTQASLNQSGGTVSNGILNLGAYQLAGGVLNTNATVKAGTVDLQAGNVAGVLDGGAVQKTTGGTVTMSNAATTVGSVDVKEGTLAFTQPGTAFTTTGDYTTRAGATTDAGQNGSTLVVGGAFTQAQDATLNVILNGTAPVITAESAKIDGKVVFNGFSDTALPVKASDIADSGYVLLQTTGGITGELSSIDTGVETPDYLKAVVQTSSDNKSLYLKNMALSWMDGGQSAGNGSFSMAKGTIFNMDKVLADQTAPAGGFDSGWDGKSLTKAGEGTLILSAANTYTGNTRIDGGTLRTDVDNALATSSDVAVNAGVLDLNGHAQTVNRLTGNGGLVMLNGATLTTVNTSTADSTHFSGDIVDGNAAGSLTKTGDGVLTLDGKTDWTGTTRLEGGELVLDGVLGGAQLVSDVIGTQGTHLILKNGANLTGTIDPTDVTVGAGSTWNVTGDSLVNNLTVDGNIKFTAPTGHTLTAGNWAGNGGTVALNTVLGNDQSPTDKIVLDGGNATGNTGLLIRQGDNSRGAKTVKGIQVVETKNGATTDAGAFHLSSDSDGYRAAKGTIVAGAYDYSLVRGGTKGNADDWYLVSELNYRPETGVYLNNKHAASTMQFHSLHDRSDASHDQGVWLRMGGETSQRNGADGQDLSENTYRIHLGGDVVDIYDGGQGNILLGIMGQYSSNNNKAESHGLRADGDVSGYSLGLYGTWYADRNTHKGAYVDAWIMSGKFSNKVSGQELDAEYYDSRNTAVSMETGYLFSVYDSEMVGVSLEPQGQIINSDYQADTHKEHNGTRVSGLSENTTTTRLGLRVSADLRESKVDNLNLFAETNWWHGPDSQSIRFDGKDIHDALPADRIEGKVGIKANLNQSLDLWSTVGFEAGEKDYAAGTAQVGLKYTF